MEKSYNFINYYRMKRTYLSALLMGALTIASVSTFTSCKDYDDDINMNTSQIKDLQEQLKTLQTALDQAKNDATTAHANFATKGISILFRPR